MEVTLRVAGNTPIDFKHQVCEYLNGSVKAQDAWMIADGIFAMAKVPHHCSVNPSVLVEACLELIRNDPYNWAARLEVFQKKWVEGFDCDN